VSAPACIGEPISWLRLERHRLGELPAAESGAVAAHLGACPACAACAAEADRPLALRPLRPAAVPAPWPSLLLRLARRLHGASPTAVLGRVALVAAAALIVVELPARAPRRLAVAPATLAGVKGGDVAVELVRERQGTVQHGATRFAAGDRWKALVTCPRDRLLFWDLAVVDGTGPPSFPLPPSAPLACGNHVALPGAFRIDAAGPAEVCVLLSDDPVDRGAASRALAAPGASKPGMCVTLWPETPAL